MLSNHEKVVFTCQSCLLTVVKPQPCSRMTEPSGLVPLLPASVPPVAWCIKSELQLFLKITVCPALWNATVRFKYPADIRCAKRSSVKMWSSESFVCHFWVIPGNYETRKFSHFCLPQYESSEEIQKGEYVSLEKFHPPNWSVCSV